MKKEKGPSEWDKFREKRSLQNEAVWCVDINNADK